MFGVSASGKTCFLHAMSQVLRIARFGDIMLQLIANRAQQQKRLSEGYMQLAGGQWPQTSDKTEPFDFKVNMQCNGHFSEIIDSLIIQDYRGGILQEISDDSEEELNKLLNSFRGSSAIIFIIDGSTLINAMDPEDRDVCHRSNTNVLEQFSARTQIQFVENIFMEYKRVESDIPPILIAISKSDVFASDFEKENGIQFIKDNLPSIFAVGSGLTAGITNMSLGENLGTDDNGNLIGTVSLKQDYNIHIPVIFGIYSELCYQYEEATEVGEKNGIAVCLNALRSIFASKVQLFINGKKAREV